MGAANSEQEARSIEFGTDLHNLEHADYINPNYTQWFDAYVYYVKNPNAQASDRPQHKPPTPTP